MHGPHISRAFFSQMDMGKIRRSIFQLLLLLCCSVIHAQQTNAPNDSLRSSEEVSMDELNRQLENPLSRFWSLIFQENLSFNSGDAISGTEVSNVLNFQPSLPVPIGKSRMLLVRPVFPLVTTPVFDESGEKTKTETGLGDVNVFSLYGPDKKDGLIWGAKVGKEIRVNGATYRYGLQAGKILENGEPTGIYLNFSIFLLSTALSCFSALLTATFSNTLVENGFLFIFIIGIIGGILLFILWWRTRKSIRSIVSKIRNRIPPEYVEQVEIQYSNRTDTNNDSDDEVEPPSPPGLDF